MINEAKLIALIGLGHVVRHQLAALSNDTRWIVVGAADIDRDKAILLPSYIRFFPNVEQLLAATEADVCVVATGPASHFEIGKRVLESGRHLILEKPCCMSLEELLELVGLAERTNCRIFPALHARHGLDVQWFLRHRDSLQLGELTGFECRFFDPYLANGWLLEAAQSLGGSWMDSGINALSVIASMVPIAFLSITSASFSNTTVSGCDDTQSRVTFNAREWPLALVGTIETHWGLGIDSKSTLRTATLKYFSIILEKPSRFFARVSCPRKSICAITTRD
jgi:predicted dehydrogenase